MTKVCPQCAQTYDESVEYCPADSALLDYADPLVGTTLDGRYLIAARLGEGGMGRVYRAKHIRLRRDAAIKVLNPSYLADPDSRRRFTSEAELLIRVDNEHVARVYDFGELPHGQLYLALEFVAGQPLSSVMNDAALPPAKVVEITRQLGAGLDAVHKCGLVHRDIKPENVMLARDADGRDVVKLIDFGIARSTRGTGHITRTGCIVGTPDFMSPEQVMGEEVDARSDIYALGVLAVVMLTGRLPFPNESFEKALASRVMGDPRPLRELAPEVAWPAAVQQVIDRALAKDPSARHATAGELAADLASAIESSQQDGRAVTAAPPVRRRPRGWAVGAGVAMAALIAVAPFALSSGAGGTEDLATGDVTARAVTPTSTQNDKEPGGPVVTPQAETPSNGPNADTGGGPLSVARPTESASPREESGRDDASAYTLPPVEVQHRLDQIEKLLDPETATPAVASSALDELAALLPHVRTGDDSTRAGLLTFQAHLHADQLVRGCGVLRAVHVRATRERYRAAARLWLDSLCR